MTGPAAIRGPAQGQLPVVLAAVASCTSGRAAESSGPICGANRLEEGFQRCGHSGTSAAGSGVLTRTRPARRKQTAVSTCRAWTWQHGRRWSSWLVEDVDLQRFGSGYMSRLSALMDRDWKLPLQWSSLERRIKPNPADVVSGHRHFKLLCRHSWDEA